MLLFAIALCLHHPHSCIVSVLGAPPRALFMTLVQQHCEMPAGQCAHFVLQVLSKIANGIGSAAKENIAHRDVTPNRNWTLAGSRLPVLLLCCQGMIVQISSAVALL